MSDKTLTIFTPTYNRAYCLDKLYNSLLNQTNNDFIWMIVDDGSNDDTEKKVKNWIEENKIDIKYIKKVNGGKHSAHNVMADKLETSLFVGVDSDDFLSNDAVDVLVKKYKEVISKRNIVGILSLKNVSKINKQVESTTIRNAYNKKIVAGDIVICIKSDILKKYRYPIIEKERFFPDAYIYDLVDKDGKFIIVNKVLCYCEYLADGYTNSINKLIKNNPQGYLLFIKSRLETDKSFKNRFFDCARYVSICFVIKEKHKIKHSPYPIITLLSFLIGYILYIRRFKNE